MNKMSQGALACGLLISSLMFGGAASAQTAAQVTPTSPQRVTQSAPAASAPAQPDVTTATYQDWLMRCVSPAGKPKVCEIVQTIQMEGQAGPIAMVAFGRVAPDAPLRLAIQVASGVWLPAGVKLQVSEKSPPIALEFKRCLQGCFAELDVDKALETSLRAATAPGSFSFEDGARRPITLQLSFKGFTAALDASLKAK